LTFTDGYFAMNALLTAWKPASDPVALETSMLRVPLALPLGVGAADPPPLPEHAVVVSRAVSPTPTSASQHGARTVVVAMVPPEVIRNVLGVRETTKGVSYMPIVEFG
jgi:hypothetical protein